MNDIQKRFLLFLVGCIGMRIYIVYLAKTTSTNNLKYMGYLSTLSAIGFLYFYLTNSRTKGTLGQIAWWHNLRPIHSGLYFLFAYYAIKNNRNSWKILLLDVIIGLISFLIYHYNSDNFSKLLN